MGSAVGGALRNESGPPGEAEFAAEAAAAAAAATVVDNVKKVEHKETVPDTAALEEEDRAADSATAEQGEAQAEGGWLGWVKGLNPWRNKDDAGEQAQGTGIERVKHAEAEVVDGEWSQEAQTQKGSKSRWSWLPWVGSRDGDSDEEDIKGAL